VFRCLARVEEETHWEKEGTERVLTRENPGFWLAFLRITVGVAWLIAGIRKVLNPNYVSADLQPTLSQWAASGYDAIGVFISSTLLPNLNTLSFALKGLELLIGVSLILGIFTRLGALCGFAIVAGAWILRHGFDSSAGYAGSTFIVLVTMLFLVFAPASRVFAADLLLVRRVVVTPPPATPTQPPAAGSPVVY
jgi:uncharacterized membrane protein YphA (DoxX/SURF4 family)